MTQNKTIKDIIYQQSIALLFLGVASTIPMGILYFTSGLKKKDNQTHQQTNRNKYHNNKKDPTVSKTKINNIVQKAHNYILSDQSSYNPSLLFKMIQNSVNKNELYAHFPSSIYRIVDYDKSFIDEKKYIGKNSQGYKDIEKLELTNPDTLKSIVTCYKYEMYLGKKDKAKSEKYYVSTLNGLQMMSKDTTFKNSSPSKMLILYTLSLVAKDLANNKQGRWNIYNKQEVLKDYKDTYLDFYKFSLPDFKKKKIVQDSYNIYLQLK